MDTFSSNLNFDLFFNKSRITELQEQMNKALKEKRRLEALINHIETLIKDEVAGYKCLLGHLLQLKQSLHKLYTDYMKLEAKMTKLRDQGELMEMLRILHLENESDNEEESHEADEGIQL